MLRRHFTKRKADEQWDFIWTPDMGDLKQYGFVEQESGGYHSTEYKDEYLKILSENNVGYLGYNFPFNVADNCAFEMDVCVLGQVPTTNGFRALISNGSDGSQLAIRYNLNNGYCWLCTETMFNENRIADFPLDGNYHTIKAALSPEYSNYWLDGVQVGENLPHSTNYVAKSWFLSHGVVGDVLIKSIKYKVGE